jgi:hypothetical protein
MWQGLARGEQAALHQAAPPGALYPVQGRYSAQLHNGGIFPDPYERSASNSVGRRRTRSTRPCACPCRSTWRLTQRQPSMPVERKFSLKVATFSHVYDTPHEQLSRPRGALRLRTFRSDQPRGPDRQGSLHELCAFPGHGARPPPLSHSLPNDLP